MKNKINKISSEKIMDLVGDEIDKSLDSIDNKKTKKFIQEIQKSKKIFLTGSGRSKLVAEAFAMRLTHLGKEAHLLGESTTPNVQKKDLVIAISGTGKTKFTYEHIKQAKKSKAKIILITANKKSEIGKKSDWIIQINAKTKTNKQKSIEPLGSLFEQAAFIYLDSSIILLMKKLKIKEKSMKKRHSKTN